MEKWYAGAPHTHTTNSDGKYTPQQLVKLAEKNGLDFLIITDHNSFSLNTPKSDKLTVIPGIELTKQGGHTNIWGVEKPIDNCECETYDEWLDKMRQAKANGAVTCINHPMCRNCTWRWPLELEKADCLEIWNSPQHTDNMKCTEFWQSELRKGKKIPIVGGSDYHRDYFVTNLLTNPVTYVYANSRNADDILAAIKAGHTTVSPGVGKTMITLICGDKIIGDTVKSDNYTKVTINVTELHKNYTLKVIGSKGVIFTHTAEKASPYTVTLPVDDNSFISAQVEYINNPVFEFVYRKIVSKKIKEKDEALPPFIYAQSGAMYFE